LSLFTFFLDEKVTKKSRLQINSIIVDEMCPRKLSGTEVQLKDAAGLKIQKTNPKIQ